MFNFQLLFVIDSINHYCKFNFAGGECELTER